MICRKKSKIIYILGTYLVQTRTSIFWDPGKSTKMMPQSAIYESRLVWVGARISEIFVPCTSVASSISAKPGLVCAADEVIVTCFGHFLVLSVFPKAVLTHFPTPKIILV